MFVAVVMLVVHEQKKKTFYIVIILHYTNISLLLYLLCVQIEIKCYVITYLLQMINFISVDVVYK